MLRKEGRYDAYAYRISNKPLALSVDNLEEGQWVTLKNDEVVIADGTTKSFLCIGSKRVGRDQVGGRIVRNVSYLVGDFANIKTTNFDLTKSYTSMTPLKVTSDGKLTPVESADVNPIIVAYAEGAVIEGQYLSICSA